MTKSLRRCPMPGFMGPACFITATNFDQPESEAFPVDMQPMVEEPHDCNSGGTEYASLIAAALSAKNNAQAELSNLKTHLLRFWQEHERPESPKWHRESRTVSPIQGSGTASHDRNVRDLPRPKRYGSPWREKPSTSRQFRFGASYSESGCITTPVDLSLEATTCEERTEMKNAFDPKELPTRNAEDRDQEACDKEKDCNKTVVLKLPAAMFADSETRGRIRDATVTFEPGRIVVEVHTRCGNSKILHCKDLPFNVDAEGSTFKIDPNGYDVQIALKTFRRLHAPGCEDAIVKLMTGEDGMNIKGGKSAGKDMIAPPEGKLASNEIADFATTTKRAGWLAGVGQEPDSEPSAQSDGVHSQARTKAGRPPPISTEYFL